MADIDYAPYIAYARQQAAQQRRETAVRYQRAWDTARQVATFLRQNYQPEQIIVFGSLCHPNIFGLHSDIDIAVDGIPWPDYLRAWNEVEALFPEFKIDLIDMAIVSESLKRRIKQEGQPL